VSHDKRIIIKGEQQAELDAAAMARVVLLLARHWLEQQESPQDGREAPHTGTAQVVKQPRGEESQ